MTKVDTSVRSFDVVPKNENFARGSKHASTAVRQECKASLPLRFKQELLLPTTK